jgi:hypothetical protein
MKPTPLYFLSLLLMGHMKAASNVPVALDSCNVVWTDLGYNSADSMPLGNGDIGLNVWTEQNGDVLFYISKTDAWTDDRGGLAKVGRVRVSLTPNPFVAGAPVKQSLLLGDGEIQITGGTTSEPVTLRIWVDANNPVVHVETNSAKPVTVKVTRDPWREPPQDKVSPDVVLPVANNRIVWYHHNEASKTREQQLLNLMFGAAIEGDEMVAGEGAALQSRTPRTRQSFAVYPLTMKTSVIEEWRAQLDRNIAKLGGLDLENTRAEHQKWWQEFWNRSWIFIQGDADAEKVTRGYVLQRFVTACAGRGAYPVKFNGTIFTTDRPNEGLGKDPVTGKQNTGPVTADFRAWGGQYWFQNTRPMYWPRLMAGDFDMMLPLFRMYSGIVKTNEATVKSYYGHDGSYMAETAPFYGGIKKLVREAPGSYTDDYFTPVLELTAMMLDYRAYTGDEAFTRETLVPVAKLALTFFSQHFSRDAQGRLLLDPDNSIEMFWKVHNPLPDIAGLHYVLDRLLKLPEDVLDSTTRGEWKKLEGELPPIPTGTRDGKKVILPYEGEQTAKSHNSENPELYAIYPFRLYGLGKPDFEMAVDTFNMRGQKRTGCWHQDPIQAAYLGITDLAKKDVTKNLTNRDLILKFPAFWDRGHDYAPDEDNGGNGENALQLMLMQSEGRRIRLLPAWPKEWEADFKLHAPYQTTVEGHVKDGRVSNLKVTPKNQQADVVMPDNSSN